MYKRFSTTTNIQNISILRHGSRIQLHSRKIFFHDLGPSSEFDCVVNPVFGLQAKGQFIADS